MMVTVLYGAANWNTYQHIVWARIIHRRKLKVKYFDMNWAMHWDCSFTLREKVT